MVFVTLGTSFAYKRKKSDNGDISSMENSKTIHSHGYGDVVSNCHKQPSVNFEKFTISTQETVQVYQMRLNH